MQMETFVGLFTGTSMQMKTSVVLFDGFCLFLLCLIRCCDGYWPGNNTMGSTDLPDCMIF